MAKNEERQLKQEIHAVARKPRDSACFLLRSMTL